jgi:hypothetical protein
MARRRRSMRDDGGRRRFVVPRRRTRYLSALLAFVALLRVSAVPPRTVLVILDVHESRGFGVIVVVVGEGRVVVRVRVVRVVGWIGIAVGV